MQPRRLRAPTPDRLDGYATTAIVTKARQLPQVSPLSYAMVQGGVYDAVNAIDRRHQPYLVMPAANPWDWKDAAASAAFCVLAALFPAQLSTLQPLDDTLSAAVPDGRMKDGGIAAGEAAAAGSISS